MKLKYGLFIGALGLLLIIISVAFASSYLVDEDMNLLENDIYNATNINATYIYQNGSLMVDTTTLLAYGYYNNLANFTGTITDTKWCVYDSANTEIDCNVEPVTDSNAGTICSGTTTYLDGEGGCDDISSVYIAQSEEGNLNVNSSDYWDHMDTPDDFVNITASGYISGQPITGSIGSGIINSSENLDHCGCMNVTSNEGLEVHYPEFTARVVDTDGTETYCYKAEGDINVTDNLQSTYYLNRSCEWNSETFETFHSADRSPGGKVRIFDALAINGVIEETKGNTLLALAKDKAEQIRIFCSSSSHLSVCNGFEITQDTFPSFNVSSGNSVYLNTYLPTDAKSTLTDETHLTHHENGSWVHTNTTGLNITHCDNGTDLVECTGTVYRQYPTYSESWNSDAKIHMLSPLTTGATYTSLSACVAATPDYSLPSMEKYVAIVHHIYCARRTDTAWNSDAWIDLRVEPVGVGGTPDLSPYLTIYADKPLLSNWDIGAYNFTNTDSWFLGNTLWDNDKSDYWNTSADLDTVISDDEISEGKIAFSTACAAGNHYYLNGNDLACESDDDTTYTASGTLLDLTGTAFSINEGTLTDTKLCTYAVGTGIVCTTDDSDTQLTEEQVQDYAWNVLAGTQTLITITYQDITNDVDFVVNNDLHSYLWTNVVDGDIPSDLTIESTKNITTTAGININDDVKMRFGTGKDACMYWDGSSLITTTVAANCG